jgi:hypothetical protein
MTALQQYFSSLGVEQQDVIVIRDDAESPQWSPQRKRLVASSRPSTNIKEGRFCASRCTLKTKHSSLPDQTASFPISSQASLGSTCTMAQYARKDSDSDHDRPPSHPSRKASIENLCASLASSERRQQQRGSKSWSNIFDNEELRETKKHMGDTMLQPMKMPLRSYNDKELSNFAHSLLSQTYNTPNS